MLLTPITLTSCNSTTEVDYDNAADFEKDLNDGKDLEGKVVTVEVTKYIPNGTLGYTFWAGEHLNFISNDNPKIEVGDEVTVEVTEVKNFLGSWVMRYEKID
jgi:translation initiation factor IF-1